MLSHMIKLLYSSHLLVFSDFLQKPFNQPMANSTFGSAPFMAQPTPYYNFQGMSKKMDIPNGKVLVHFAAFSFNYIIFFLFYHCIIMFFLLLNLRLL